jgi:hypothetical protein
MMIERIAEVVMRVNQNAIDEMPTAIEKRLTATDEMQSVTEKKLTETDEMPSVIGKKAIAVMAAVIETSTAEMTVTERIATANTIRIGDAIVTKMMANAIAIDEMVIDVESERQVMMSETGEIGVLTVTATTEIDVTMIANAVGGESAS